MIKVLVVEDSAVLREFLDHILTSDPAIQVIRTVSDGALALEAVMHDKPDVITMDINMPRMDGFEATRRIMETRPTPIIIVSGSWDTHDVATTFRAVEAGALAVLPRPPGPGLLQNEAMSLDLIQTVKLMSEVKVVRRWSRPVARTKAPAGSQPAELARDPRTGEVKLVAIGASTGGPLAILTILSALPKDFAVPLVIVQHIAAGFIQGFVEWLSQSSGRPVHVATHGEILLPGHAYVAPDEFQMKVEPGARLSLSRDEPENGLRPAVSYLFRSVAEVYGPKAAGVLLTGMGKDGAAELGLMKEKGALTLAQDEASSVVHGMPGEAIRLGAASYTLSPEMIAAALTRLANHG